MNNLKSTQMKNTECTECTECTDFFLKQCILSPESALKCIDFFLNVLCNSLNEYDLN